ncbi:uncharacterized protein E0L32_011555 [Thyridium curvatum]|uniref:J domain-containing protein n=1 Tax=Thyridium curvatum TaxID=1093900 RepID=A0A507BEX4_9PEZI|nr:uncharacterized protein E0L32_011555 [Thyridium curvatum]TPX18517.1 hypothetical protein E0L32_011555 [Thyridium curvatum]
MDDAELVAYARDSAAAHDFYALLGVDAATPREDVHRAWRRKGLKYHPDKAGAAYDAAKYELFERARNVLTSDAARAAYDAARSAAQHRAAQADLMSAERRRFKDELEAAEARGQQARQQQRQEGREADAERERLREAGRRRMEERERAVREAEERERRREDERIAEIERKLREKEEKSRRRAERKARESGVGAGDQAPTTAKVEEAQAGVPVPPVADPEWRKLLGSQATPFDKRPIYTYTIARMKAAEAGRQEKLASQGTPAQPFVPQWDEVKDPEVRRFISRVPKFGAPPASEDTTMTS